MAKSTKIKELENFEGTQIFSKSGTELFLYRLPKKVIPRKHE